MQTRSFQYIDDLIRGMVAVMDGDEIGPFNIGNPGEFTMLELANVSVCGFKRLETGACMCGCSESSQGTQRAQRQAGAAGSRQSL
jgi:nucleoside-diphosphate-sugar epimerase